MRAVYAVLQKYLRERDAFKAQARAQLSQMLACGRAVQQQRDAARADAEQLRACAVVLTAERDVALAERDAAVDGLERGQLRAELQVRARDEAVGERDHARMQARSIYDAYVRERAQCRALQANHNQLAVQLEYARARQYDPVNTALKARDDALSRHAAAVRVASALTIERDSLRYTVAVQEAELARRALELVDMHRQLAREKDLRASDGRWYNGAVFVVRMAFPSARVAC